MDWEFARKQLNFLMPRSVPWQVTILPLLLNGILFCVNYFLIWCHWGIPGCRSIMEGFMECMSKLKMSLIRACKWWWTFVYLNFIDYSSDNQRCLRFLLTWSSTKPSFYSFSVSGFHCLTLKIVLVVSRRPKNPRQWYSINTNPTLVQLEHTGEHVVFS